MESACVNPVAGSVGGWADNSGWALWLMCASRPVAVHRNPRLTSVSRVVLFKSIVRMYFGLGMLVAGAWDGGAGWPGRLRSTLPPLQRAGSQSGEEGGCLIARSLASGSRLVIEALEQVIWPFRRLLAAVFSQKESRLCVETT